MKVQSQKGRPLRMFDREKARDLIQRGDLSVRKVAAIVGVPPSTLSYFVNRFQLRIVEKPQPRTLDPLLLKLWCALVEWIYEQLYAEYLSSKLPPKKSGRPAKIIDAAKARELLSSGLSITETAVRLKISRNTLSRRLGEVLSRQQRPVKSQGALKKRQPRPNKNPWCLRCHVPMWKRRKVYRCKACEVRIYTGKIGRPRLVVIKSVAQEMYDCVLKHRSLLAAAEELKVNRNTFLTMLRRAGISREPDSYGGFRWSGRHTFRESSDITSLIERIDRLVPRYLTQDLREDVQQEVLTSIIESRNPLDLETLVREQVRRINRDHNPKRMISIDAPLWDGTQETLADRLVG